MREIKFRAWHKEMKLMYRVLSLVLGQREQEASLVRYGTTLVRYEGPYITCHLDEIELMQYTGLKDKNGKEIYEGDIVTSHTSFDHWNDKVSLVKYEEGTWNYSYAIQEFSDYPERDWEIIGNIYENPKLLEATS